MGNAAHIGRVGALAVALGIGSWLASTPCVADAQPSNTSTTGSTASAGKPKPTAVAKSHRVTPSLATAQSSAKANKPQQLSAPVAHVPTAHSIATTLHSLLGDGTPPSPATISSMLAYMGDELRRITGVGKTGAVTTSVVPATGPPNLLMNPPAPSSAIQPGMATARSACPGGLHPALRRWSSTASSATRGRWV